MGLVTVNVTTDNYGIETRWELEQMCNEGGEGILLLQGLYLGNNWHYTHTVCAPDVQLRFTIKDDYGDGICCYDGNGSYTIEKDGITGVEHDREHNNWVKQVHDFGECPNATAEPTGSPVHPTPPPTPLPTTLRPTTSRPTHPPVSTDETITVDAFMYKFLFSPIEACIDSDREDQCESPHQCAYACTLLENCVGFVRNSERLGGIFQTAADDHSCNDGLANPNAVFYERNVDMKFTSVYASSYQVKYAQPCFKEWVLKLT